MFQKPHLRCCFAFINLVRGHADVVIKRGFENPRLKLDVSVAVRISPEGRPLRSRVWVASPQFT